MGLEESLKIKSPEIKPEKITSPIQLLAVWLSGLILIDGAFLIAAAAIQNPPWVPALLVISSVIFVPLFLVLIFMMQTKFRPELQEDSYYSKYLDKERDNLNTVVDSVSMRAELEGKFRSIEGHIMVIEDEMKNKHNDKDEANMLAQMQQLQDEYSRVIIEIAHSVKSYLHSILGGIERLGYEIDKHEQPDKDLLKNISHRISADINGLSRLFDTLKFQSPLLNNVGGLKTTARWGVILLPIIRELSAAAAEKRVNISADDQHYDFEITGDIPAIKTAIYNICENAVKYAKPGSAIRVNIVKSQKRYIITVENEGLGINVEDAKHIFDRGFRGRNAVQIPDGMGMGLFATNQIAKLHGGEVVLKSPSPSTTIVEFILPLKDGESNA